MFQSNPSKPAATADTANQPRTRVEEKLVDVEVVSYSGSSDVSETEEHVTVHAKREPLPWSMRGAAYDKPLPGVTSDRAPSPLPAISPVQQKSPLHTFFGPTPIAAGKDTTGGDAGSPETPPQPVSRRFRDLTTIPTPEAVASPLSAGSASPALPLAPIIDISSPRSAEHQRSPAPSADTDAGRAPSVQASVSSIEAAPAPSASPIEAPSALPTTAERGRSPSPFQLSGGASPSQRSTDQVVPLSSPKPLSPSPKTTSPHPLPMDFFETSKRQPPSPETAIDIEAAALETAAREPLPPSPKERSPSPAVSLDILEAGLSPQTQPQPQPQTEKVFDHGSSPAASLSPLESSPSPHTKQPVTDLGQKYREDWKVQRAHYVDESFDPELFNESRALREAPYWRSIIAKSNGPNGERKPRSEETSKEGPSSVQKLTPEAVAIPIAPHSPTLLTGPEAPSSREAPSVASPKESISPFEPAPDATQLINNLRQSLGERNEQGQSYDWPYWQWFFSEDGDRSPDNLLTHLHGEQFAPLPQSLLPFLWTALAGDTTVNQDRYNEILLEGNQDGIYANQLAADVDTSRLPVAAQRQQLFRLVAAYLNYDPEFTYTPAITTIGASLVNAGLSDEDAFAILTHIMMTHEHRELLREPEQEGGPAAYTLEALLTDIDPELASHLQHHGVTADLYAPIWYSVLFEGWIPSGLKQQYLSSYLVEGEAASHRLALTMLVENRERLLIADSFGEIMNILLSGHFSDVHPDWNVTYKPWMALMRQVPLTSKDLSQLAADYELIKRERHEQSLLSTLSLVEGEHALLGGYLAWIFSEIQRLCADRERLYLELLEWHLDCEGHRECIRGQRRQIHLLETDLLALNKDHQDDMRKLNALLASEPSSMPSTTDRHHQRSPSQPHHHQMRRQKTSKCEK